MGRVGEAGDRKQPREVSTFWPAFNSVRRRPLRDGVGSGSSSEEEVSSLMRLLLALAWSACSLHLELCDYNMHLAHFLSHLWGTFCTLLCILCTERRHNLLLRDCFQGLVSHPHPLVNFSVLIGCTVTCLIQKTVQAEGASTWFRANDTFCRFSELKHPIQQCFFKLRAVATLVGV